MKNKFIRLFASLCFTLFLVSCNQIVPEDEPKSELKEGNVIISLKQNPAKTISPVLDGFSYLDVNEWTVTFRETSGKYKDITESFREGTLSVKIPVGKFDVILEGSIQQSENLPTSIPYYGESSFEITGDETSPVPVSVIVSPKKTAGGTGTFNYTLNIVSCPEGAVLTSKLVPYGNSEKKEEIILETTPNSITEPTSGTNAFTITRSDIPSGFYKLSILLTVAADNYSKDIFSTFDNLVEILDNKTVTSGSKVVTFVGEGEKTYYVSCSDSATGNGVFESMPGYYDRIFETNDTVATVNLKFVDDIVNQTCPQIDVSKLQNKTYNLFNKDTLIYSISKDIETGINISENNENKENYKINLIDSVKLAAGENTVVNYNGGNTLHLILGGGVSVKAPEVSGVIIYANEYNDYYAITKNPLVISSSDLRVTLNDRNGSGDFTILKKASTEEGCYNYYFAKVNDISVSLSDIPGFTIVDNTDLLEISGKTYYAGDTVTLKAKANASASFADGTTFIWYVNGIEQTSTIDELSLTFGKGNTALNNSVLCIASYNGEYRSVAVDINAIELNAIEQVALLYSTNPSCNTKTANFSIVSDKTTSISLDSVKIINDQNFVIDSYIDSNQNIYTLYKNDGTYYYSKSVFTGVGYETPAKVYEIIGLEGNTFQEIKLGDDGIVYLLGKEDINYKIWSITNSDSSDTGGTASLTEKLSFGKEVFTNSSRTTFFVDENSDIYYIKETPTTDQATNTTTNKVELVKRVSGTETVTEDTVCTIFDFSISSGAIISTSISNSDTMITLKDASACCPEFTDMRIINGKLYLLVRHLSQTSGYSYSTGCVICVDLSSSETTVSGWDTNKYNSSTDSYSHELLTFYGPDKIVAIKPKKILIADDGVEHGSGYSAKDKQRLVVFDLESNAITGTIAIPVGIEFSYYDNGYSFFY